jgi:exoribonuclease R
VHVRRTPVRSVAQLDYDTVRDRLAADSPHPSCALVPELGRLSRARGQQGAVELQLPETTRERASSGGYELALHTRMDVEVSNTEKSLLAAMAANLVLVPQSGVDTTHRRSSAADELQC